MSVNLETHHINQYTTNVSLLLQQMGSKLMPTVSIGSHSGEAAVAVDQYGKVEAQEVTGRFEPINRQDINTDRRWVQPRQYDIAQIIDTSDKLKMIQSADPKSAMVQAAVSGLGRKIDDLIISAIYSSAVTGETASSGTTAFNSSNVVAVNESAASATGMTVAKLEKAMELALANEADPMDDEFTLLIAPKQWKNLLDDIKMVSNDYISGDVLASGKIPGIVGIKQVIVTNRLPVDTNSYRRCFMYGKKGVHLGMWNNLQTTIDKRTDIRLQPYQLYSWMSAGATRTEENRCYEILASEA